MKVPKISEDNISHGLEEEFKKRLVQQLSKKSSSLDLSLNGSLFPIENPRLVWEQILVENNLASNHFSDILSQKTILPNYHFYYFDHLEQTKEFSSQETKLYWGKPFGISQFLTDQPDKAFIDFKERGVAYLTLTSVHLSPPSITASHEVLRVICNYIFSDELWLKEEPLGKWPRFHQKLIFLFQKYKLLINSPHIGYYQLGNQVACLDKYGFRFEVQPEGLVMAPSWSFSLSDLKLLESCLQQEFSCLS